MRSINIAFFDSHPIILDGVLSAFKSFSGFSVLDSGISAADMVSKTLAQQLDVVVLDVCMAGNAYEAIRKVCTERSQTKVVVFTGLAGVENAVRALEAGASGFVAKTSTASELAEAVRKVMDGETFITPSFASGVITALRDASIRKQAAVAMKLSLREEQIVKHLLRGKTNREIAHKLSISEKTVKHYMTILMQKLNARNRIEVVLAAQGMRNATAGRASAGVYSN